MRFYRQLFSIKYKVKMKSKSTIFLIWLFLGLFGGHRFYVGKTMSGLLYAFTFGFLFIGWALDFFRLGSMVDDYNLRFAVMRGANQNNNANTNMNNIVINMPAPQAASAAPTSQQTGAAQNESAPSPNA